MKYGNEPIVQASASRCAPYLRRSNAIDATGDVLAAMAASLVGVSSSIVEKSGLSMRSPMTGTFALATLAGALLAPPNLAATATPLPRDEPYVGTVRLQVDASDLDHRIFRIREQLPVRPGPLTLLFPRFLPGTHGPFGQVDRLAGLEITAAGKPLAWRRDTVDPYAFQVDVPAGTSELALEFQFLSALSRMGGRIVVTH